MKNYIITYHLRNTWENYYDFYDTIKCNYPEHQHPLEETWFIKTDDNSQQILNKIKPYLKDTDTIFIVEITDNYSGWMPKSIWGWLKLENEYNK